MSFRDLLADTLRTIGAHKLRTALTMFGIAWGIISITLMVGAGEGLRVGQERAAASFGKNVMIVFAGRTSMQAGGARAGKRVRWKAQNYAAIRQEATACAEVMPELGNQMPVRSEFNSGLLLVTGSLPAFAEIRSIEVKEGRFYNEKDNVARRRVAFLGSDAKKQLFGGHPALGATIQIGGIPYTVIGVMKEKEQDSSYDGRDVSKIFAPFWTVQQDFPHPPPLAPDDVDRLLVTPRSLGEHERCKAQVRQALGRIHQFDARDEEAAHIWDTVANQKAFYQMTQGMKYFLGAVGLVTLLLGGISVMNVMLVAVRERTREIGIRKAVGATRGEILGQFFAETLLIVAASGAMGAGVAFGVCQAVNSLPMPRYFAGLLPRWEAWGIAVGVLGAVAVLAALCPAARAAAVDPVEALRYEAGG